MVSRRTGCTSSPLSTMRLAYVPITILWTTLLLSRFATFISEFVAVYRFLKQREEPHDNERQKAFSRVHLLSSKTCEIDYHCQNNTKDTNSCVDVSKSNLITNQEVRIRKS